MQRFILLSFFFNHIISNLYNIFIFVSKVLLDNGAYEEADLLYKKANEIYRDDVTFLLNRGNVSVLSLSYLFI